MSTGYSGLPAVARRYWRDFTYAFIGSITLVLFTGAFAAVVVLTLLPAAKWYFLIAVVSFVVHFAALFVKDVWTGEYDPSQSTMYTAAAFLALVMILGTTFSTMLLIGTIIGYFLSIVFGDLVIIGVATAAYYPVLEVLLIRQGVKTPGGLVFQGTALAIMTVINIHKSIAEALPVIGRQRRPQT